MKLTKSILREMIKDVLSEADIMDKEVKNPKTGNKIKVRTALQLPDEHPANKKAKDVIEKVLGTNVEYDGENVFTAKGKRAAEAPLGTIFIDYYKHPLYGDTFEIFSTMSGVTGTEKAENSRDALKALIKFTKKNKRTFLK